VVVEVAGLDTVQIWLVALALGECLLVYCPLLPVRLLQLQLVVVELLVQLLTLLVVKVPIRYLVP